MTEERKNGQEAYVDALIARSRAAQRVVADYTQAQVDAIAKMYAKVVFDNSEMLARVAAEESRMGVFEDKVKKCQAKSRIIWNSLRDKKTVGIIAEHPEEGIVEVAKPIGVVCAATPCTNPVVTPMCNAMFAVKGRNTIIISPHPRSKQTTKLLADLYYAELDRMGVPRDIFLYVEEPTIAATQHLMANCDVVLATGGPGVVKSAYSSGKPSFGVGAGNVQGIWDENIDFKAAAARVIASRIFDNGIICAGDQTVIAPASQFAEILEALRGEGAVCFEDKETVDRFRRAIFPDGTMNRELVGQPVRKVAEAAGVPIPEGTRAILLYPGAYGAADPLSKEKMCPVMTVYKWDTFAEAVAIAQANLEYNGAGHTCSIQSNDREHVEYAGTRLPVSRVLVNQSSASMAGGSFLNGLNPTTTLGCGTWGNNSIAENLTYYHLFNRSRISYVKENAAVPTDAELWG